MSDTNETVETPTESADDENNNQVQKELTELTAFMSKIQAMSAAWWDSEDYSNLKKEHRGKARLRICEEFKDLELQNPKFFNMILREKPDPTMLQQFQTHQENRIQKKINRKDALKNFAAPSGRRYLQKYLKKGVKPLH